MYEQIMTRPANICIIVRIIYIVKISGHLPLSRVRWAQTPLSLAQTESDSDNDEHDSNKFQEPGKEKSLEEKFQKTFVKPLQPLLCQKAKYSPKMKQLCFNLRGRIICLKILVRTNNFQVTSNEYLWIFVHEFQL